MLLNRVLNALQKYVGHGVIRVHHLRAIRSGRFHHVEAHLVVPEFWSVERAHQVSEDVAASVIRDLGVEIRDLLLVVVHPPDESSGRPPRLWEVARRAGGGSGRA